MVDFFATHSNFSVKRFGLLEIANLILSDDKTIKEEGKASAIRYLKKKSPEYVFFEDDGELSANPVLINELCDVIRRIGDKTAVIIASEYAANLSLFYGEAVMVDIIGLNEKSLKICASGLRTEEIYQRNCYEAIKSGVVWANQDFYDNYITNKIIGDGLFCHGDYQGALEKYNDAISFHSSYGKDRCSINDFLSIVLYVRCIACFLYGKWPGKTDYLKANIEQSITGLRQSELGRHHGKMLKEYYLTFLGLKDGWLEKKNFLLFLNEYAF